MTTNDKLTRARRWVNSPIARLFRAEIDNERFGGVSPSTLASAIDSLSQGGAEAFGMKADDVVALLMVRDIAPRKTPLADLLDRLEGTR